MDAPKRLVAVFFRTSAGREPVRDWLRGLGKPDSTLIGADIKTVEFGWPVGMPTCRPMGHGLFEVRTDLPGNRIARVLFAVGEGRLFLLHGFIKKDRKTPREDLALALARKRELEGN